MEIKKLAFGVVMALSILSFGFLAGKTVRFTRPSDCWTSPLEEGAIVCPKSPIIFDTYVFYRFL
jgi:hypothetical protein